MTASILETSRVVSFISSGLMCRYGSFHKDNYAISLVVADYDISKRWYQATQNFNSSMSVDFELYLVHIGRSSVHLYTEMIDTILGQQFVKGLWKLVFFDQTTRKSKAIPEWVRQNLQEDISKNLIRLRSREDPLLKEANIPLSYQPSAKPEATFQHKVKITPCEINSDEHTNNSHYIRFCMECASLALLNKQLPYFQADVHSVHTAKMLYSQETVLGDVLDVFVWPSQASPLDLCFCIEKLGEIVFSCLLSFYPLTTSKY